MKRVINRFIFKAFVVLVTLGIVLLITLLGALWLERQHDVTLPQPTGPFAVGCTTYAWGDESPDTLAPVAGTKREIFIWMWYPAVDRPAKTYEYLPSPWRTELERTQPGIFKIMSRDLSKVHSYSLTNADISPKQSSYPVVIFRAGASSQVTNYTTLVEDLASYGYIVVGIDAPYRTRVVVFPDGRVVERTPENNPELFSGEELNHRAIKLMAAWTSDMSFVLDKLGQLNISDESGKFRGKLDMTRVGVFGHSFGGAQAAQFCHEDSRCKAGIDIDGFPLGSVVKTGLHQPFMFLISGEGDFSTDDEIRKFKAYIQSIYDRLPENGRKWLVISGANHFTFSDDGALLKSRIILSIFRFFGKLGINGPRQLAVTSYCVCSFFNEYLKGTNGPRFDVPTQLYPEIQILD
jgi:dienelactone hydrolase